MQRNNCAHPECPVMRAVYAYAATDAARYCRSHAHANMRNVVSKRCPHPDCHSFPAYAYQRSDELHYCKQHAHEGMVNVRY